MQRPQKTAKAGYPCEGMLETEHAKENGGTHEQKTLSTPAAAGTQAINGTIKMYKKSKIKMYN